MPTPLSRRKFLELSALAAAAGCTLALPAVAGPATGFLFGVQLYMFRRQAVADLAGVLKAIHQVGFTEIELYWIAYTHPAAELKSIIRDSGLRCPAAHVDYAGLDTKIDYIHQLGCEYIVCPMLPKDQWHSLDGFRQAAAQFNTWGKAIRDRSMTFAFHNHDYEFLQQGGSTGFAELMAHTDPALVKLEFDCYWLTQAGQDPLAMLKKYADRARLIHLKDRTPNAPVSYNMDPDAEHFTELGKGTIAWPAIFAQAKQQGIHYAFMDQDETAEPTLQSLKESYTYLQTLKA